MSSLSRTLSAGSQVKNANKLFSGNVKPFIPGKQWMKPKRVSWFKTGVTDVKYFDFTLGSHARMKGENSRLLGTPGSSIKNANPKQAQPFVVPSLYTAKKIKKKKVSKEKLLDHGYPCVDVDDLYPEVSHEESEKMKDLRDIYKSCKDLHECDRLKDSKNSLYRTQPSRYNYCDN